MSKGLCLSLFCFNALAIHAQEVSTQMWYEYMLNLPFGKNYNMENAFTYSTTATGPLWRAYDYSLCLEKSINSHLDLLAQSVFSYTNQTSTFNTFEVRPIVGGRIHFTPNRRIQTRLLLRLEYRNFKNLDTKSWSHVVRPRARAEVIFPINNASYSSDKTWYAITDLELLYNVEDVRERFANRLRIRIGGGYRLNHKFRFEVLFMSQQSREAIESQFETTDNIFRIRIKHFLLQSSNLNGTGN